MFSSRLTGATRRLPQRLALVLTLTGCSGSTAHTPRTGASTESSTSEVALVSAESTGSSSGPRGIRARAAALPLQTQGQHREGDAGQRR